MSNMKSPRIVWAYLAVMLILGSCAQEDEILSIEEIGGDFYSFPSSRDLRNSLLYVASNNGVIAAFDTQNGLFQELYTLRGKDTLSSIYDLIVRDDGIFYSFQDGGIRLIYNWKDEGKKVFEIPEPKGTEYSPYKLFYDDRNEQRSLFASTSNGVFRWPLGDLNAPLDSAHIVKAEESLEPLGFFSLVPDGRYGIGLLSAGEGGVFSIGTNREQDTARQVSPKEIKETVLAMHDDYCLMEDGTLRRDYSILEECYRFKYSPHNFVVHGNYIYAVSETHVEVIGIRKEHGNNGEFDLHYVIKLPEKHPSRPRNSSCRQICLIMDNYLFVAPGGTFLYRIPLAPYRTSEEVLSLCTVKDKIYALTANNDLFFIPILEAGKLGAPRYLSSFRKEDQISLLGADPESNLVVSVNDTQLYVYSPSRRRILPKPFLRTDIFEDKKSIKCSYWTGDAFYQGRVDMVREFRLSSNPHNLPTLFPHKKDDGLECKDSVSDYYPKALAKVKNNLVIGTLHSGVVLKHLQDDDQQDDANKGFTLLISKADYTKIYDIKAVEEDNSGTIYVLDDKHLSRVHVVADTVDFMKPCELPEVRGMEKYLNRIVPISDSQCFLYSDYYDFCSGVYLFSFLDGNKEDELIRNEPKYRFCEGSTINTAHVISLARGEKYLLLGGKDGIIILDWNSGKHDSVVIQKPSDYRLQKSLAAWWPWSVVVIAVMCFAIQFNCLFGERIIQIDGIDALPGEISSGCFYQLRDLFGGRFCL